MTSEARRRAIGVIRVSQLNGRDDDDLFASPDVQRERMNDLCKREKLDLIRVYEELDVKGGSPLNRRAGLLAAIEAVEAGDAGVIVVGYFDRLVRSLEVQAQVLRRVEAAGGQVLTADLGQVSTKTAGQWLNANLHGMVSEYYNRLTAEKCAAAQVRAVERGDAPVALPPGLCRIGKRVAKDPEKAPIVAEAVKMRAEGATVQKVREYLAAYGIERSYHGTTSLLKSRLLIGEIVFGANRRPEDVLRGTCPPVVDREVWEQAQRVSAPRGRKAKSDRLLARLGVLRCGTCGARMVVGTANRSQYFIYRCPPTGVCQRRVTIAAVAVEQVVVDAVRTALDGCVGVRALQDNIRSARAALERAQINLDSAIRALADFTSEPAAVERLRELRQQRDEARDRVERLGAPDDQTFVLLGEDWDALSIEDQRRSIQATLDQVRVRPAERGQPPEDRIEVVYHDAVMALSGQTPSLPEYVA